MSIQEHTQLHPRPPSETNNRYVIVDEFVDVTKTGWARAFFIANYIIGVAVILNLVVTVVINSFWDEYKRTVKPTTTLVALHDAAAQSAAHTAAASGSGAGGAYPSFSHGSTWAADRLPPVRGSVISSTSSLVSLAGADNDEPWDGEVAASGPARGMLGGGGARVAGEEVGAGGARGRGRTVGDEEGMEAERVMTTRASQRRLAISGIT